MQRVRALVSGVVILLLGSGCSTAPVNRDALAEIETIALLGPYNPGFYPVVTDADQRSSDSGALGMLLTTILLEDAEFGKPAEDALATQNIELGNYIRAQLNQGLSDLGYRPSDVPGTPRLIGDAYQRYVNLNIGEDAILHTVIGDAKYIDRIQYPLSDGQEFWPHITISFNLANPATGRSVVARSYACTALDSNVGNTTWIPIDERFVFRTPWEERENPARPIAENPVLAAEIFHICADTAVDLFLGVLRGDDAS